MLLERARRAAHEARIARLDVRREEAGKAFTAAVDLLDIVREEGGDRDVIAAFEAGWNTGFDRGRSYGTTPATTADLDVAWQRTLARVRERSGER